MSISSSERRRQVVISTGDRSIRPSRAASRRSPTPAARTTAAPPSPAAAPVQQLADRLGGQRGRPHALQLGRRAGQHDHDRAASRVHDQPWRGADRVEPDRPARHCRLLAPPAAIASRLHPVFAASRPRSRRSCGPAPRRAPGRPRRSGNGLGGQVVGGRAEAAAGDDELAAPVGVELQPGQQVGRPVADGQHLGHLDPELAEPLGQPRPVRVGDLPGQQLGAGQQDPGAHLHTATLCQPGRVVRAVRAAER